MELSEIAVKMDPLLVESIETVRDYLKGDREGGDDVAAAVKMVGAGIKMHATLGANADRSFAMVRAITDKPEEMRRYVFGAEPRIKELLTDKKEEAKRQ